MQADTAPSLSEPDSNAVRDSLVTPRNALFRMLSHTHGRPALTKQRCILIEPG